MRKLNIEAKGIETMRDHDGGTAFSANIYIDNKKVGYIREDGWGGPLDVGIPKQHLDKIEAHVETLPESKEEFYDYEVFLSELVYKKLDEKDLKKLLKKSVFIDPENPKDGIQFFKVKWDERVKAEATRKFPNYIFLNDMPFNEALKIYSEGVSMRLQSSTK